MSSYSKTLMLWQSGNPSRAWNSILRNAVSWVYQDPDPLQTPLPQANRTHHEYWRCNKVPGCQPQGYRFLEDTHRKYLQEAQQHAQDLKTQPQVLWWGLKTKYLLQHSPLELWILLVCLDPAQEVSDSEIRDKSKKAAWYTTNRNRNTSSLPSILELLQWESLDSRRSKIQLIQTDSIMCPYYMYKGVCRFICVVIASLSFI